MAKNHFLALDGLRGIAALAVVLFHRRWWVQDGLHLDHAYLAVDFFFLLSGFVIAHAYQARLANGMSFGQFLRIRLIRLGPMLVLGGLLGVGYLLAKRTPMNLPNVLAMIGVVFALPAPLPIALNPGSAFPINGPSWSLFFEMIVNIGFALALPWLNKRVMLGILAASFVWLAVWTVHKGGVSHLGHTYPEFFGGVPRTVFSFLLGVLMYRWRQEGKLPSLPGGMWGAALLLLATFTPPALMPGNAVYELVCIVVVFPVVIMMAAGAQLTGRTAAFAGFSGALSYPLYIVHYPLLFWFEAAIGRGSLWWLLAATVTIVVLSYAALKLVDEPVRAWLQKRSGSTGGGVSKTAIAGR